MQPNITRLRDLIAKIENEPWIWNQKLWHLDGEHCLAGLAQLASGKPADERTVFEDARAWLGLSETQAKWLFHSGATLDDFNDFALRPHFGFGEDGKDRIGISIDVY
jgi:hypothetical protein